MKRIFYRCLIWLHPRSFRERFGDEMLCVFDEATHASVALFFVDGLVSLARQWLFRSGIWKFAVGAALSIALSCVFLISWAHSEARWQNVLAVRAPALEKPASPLDKAQFNREAAQAVAMLARFRKDDKKKPHSLEREPAAPHDAASQD